MRYHSEYMINSKNLNYTLKFGITGSEENYIIEKTKSITCPKSDEMATKVAGFVAYDKAKDISILVKNMRKLNETES